MIIHGKERHFMLTVGSSAEISEFCPDGDLAKMAVLFEQPYGKEVRSVAKIVAALSRGYENSKKYEDPSHVAEPLTVDEILSLNTDEYQALVTEALAAFRRDTNVSVETESSKKNTIEAST